jgi:hypothetical protein
LGWGVDPRSGSNGGWDPTPGKLGGGGGGGDRGSVPSVGRATAPKYPWPVA